MDFLQEAIAAYKAFEKNEYGEAKELHKQAKLLAALSIAHSLQRIANRLELMTETGTGYSGEDIAALRVSNLT